MSETLSEPAESAIGCCWSQCAASKHQQRSGEPKTASSQTSRTEETPSKLKQHIKHIYSGPCCLPASFSMSRFTAEPTTAVLLTATRHAFCDIRQPQNRGQSERMSSHCRAVTAFQTMFSRWETTPCSPQCKPAEYIEKLGVLHWLKLHLI